MAEKYVKVSECEKYFYEHLDDNSMIGAMNAIDEMPEADVVEVVRCRDCKYAHYWYGNDTLGNTKYLCHYIEHDKFYPDVFSDDFCSRGERRADNEKKAP